MRVGIEVIVGTGFIIAIHKRHVVGLINGLVGAFGVAHGLVEVVGTLGGLLLLLLGALEADLRVVGMV